jgi:hypothetical protein
LPGVLDGPHAGILPRTTASEDWWNNLLPRVDLRFDVPSICENATWYSATESERQMTIHYGPGKTP